MKVNLDRLGDEPYNWQESLALSRDDLEHPDLLTLSEVACRGQIRRTTPGFLLEVVLRYEQILGCTRCLSELVTPVETKIDLLVSFEREAASNKGPEEEQRLEEGDLGLLSLSSPHLDTRPLVIEEIELRVPLKPLCRDDCAGLCAVCGANLNTGPCQCRPATDSRWAALAKLKER